MSDLADAWNFIYINGERTTSPYTIKAIGDTNKLQSALSIKGGYVDTYDNFYSINIQTDSVNISKYSGNITLDYEKK